MSDMETPPSAAIPWRVGSLERRVEQLDEHKAEKAALDELKQDVKSMRNALYGLAGSVLVAAVIFALAVFQLTAGGG